MSGGARFSVSREPRARVIELATWYVTWSAGASA